ncbi:MAG: isoleucine--tRNA ligase [Actinobacteria bacterium]|nr:isoleucine--tRNA ligase [Actinomycetota bacterium]
MTQPFDPVDPRVSFPELERAILEFWRETDVFGRSLELRRGAPEWIFYEGPPTANGKPGIHHVEPRTFKDVYPRFKTMTGHLVRRKGGWDCHGLPVELEVEKEIGTTGKRDIEAFGVAEFNRLCRESVTRYVDDFERLTERIGFWIDMSDAYWTMSTEYVESVWWSLKRLHQRGLLAEADKVTAYCPRCGTALSDAEVAMGYETVQDPSLYLRFPIERSPGDGLDGASLLVWTTTPWTLPSNTGAAVDPGADYVLAERGGERFVLGASLLDRVLPGSRMLRTLRGDALVGIKYAPPYPNVEGAHTVVAADFVSMDEGTGVVHMAPAFGADDLIVGRAQGWPVFKPVDDAGRFTDLAPEFIRGLFVKDADPKIMADLRERDILLREETYEHAYPFCWRCRTPLLYYARTSWYVATTKVKDRLLEVNESVSWFPEHIKHGRYGNWLENNVDWALSRERYWGTPLPIWRCANEHQTPVGSLRELGELAGRDVADVDPHKPYIDEITFECPSCGETATRVPEVIDTWYDSGAMPFAQWGYHPELGRGLKEFERSFPADFISEAIDQTRGWFYTLMAEGVLHFDSTTYRNVVCLGHLVAADGRKMSKSLGNQFDPWEALDRQGADALRWWMLTSGSPWASRRIGHDALDEIVRQFMLTLWNVYAFFVTYANAEGFDPASDPAPPVAARPLLDRWAMSRLASTVRTARDGLEAYDATGAGRAIQSFVDDLSNWYVRRSRRRFWNPGGGASEDTLSAFHTLHECLVALATLLAPFTPFVAEALWRNLAAGRGGRPDSVHLADYPEPDVTEGRLDDAMAAARAIVELGRHVRTETKTRTRQPLAEAVVHYAGDHEALAPLLDVVADELNVKRIEFAETVHELGLWRAKPNYRALGPKLGGRVKEVASALAADDGTAAVALARGETVTLAGISISPADVDLAQQVREGWGIASEGGLTVALDLELTPELRQEGLARELVRLVQDARRSAGLDVSDRIALAVDASGEIAEALRAQADYVKGETLAAELIEAASAEGFRQEAEIEGSRVAVSVRKI